MAQMPQVTCYCGSTMCRKKGAFGQFWGCVRWPVCDGVIGAHPDGAPLGIPADPATRKARIAAHSAFDTWWRSRGWKRSRAYTWLAENGARPHIAEMDTEQCRMLVEQIGAETP